MLLSCSSTRAANAATLATEGTATTSSPRQQLLTVNSISKHWTPSNYGYWSAKTRYRKLSASAATFTKQQQTSHRSALSSAPPGPVATNHPASLTL